jgi:hypothetical protein
MKSHAYAHIFVCVCMGERVAARVEVGGRAEAPLWYQSDMECRQARQDFELDHYWRR